MTNTNRWGGDIRQERYVRVAKFVALLMAGFAGYLSVQFSAAGFAPSEKYLWMGRGLALLVFGAQMLYNRDTGHPVIDIIGLLSYVYSIQTTYNGLVKVGIAIDYPLVRWAITVMLEFSPESLVAWVFMSDIYGVMPPNSGNFATATFRIIVNTWAMLKALPTIVNKEIQAARKRSPKAMHREYTPHAGFRDALRGHPQYRPPQTKHRPPQPQQHRPPQTKHRPPQPQQRPPQSQQRRHSPPPPPLWEDDEE